MEVEMYGWARWQDWFCMMLGTWVYITSWVLTPWVLGAPTVSTATWVAWIFGLLIIAVATWALAVPDSQWPEIAQMLLAALLFVSPRVLGFTNLGAFSWGAWIAGIVLAALSVGALATLHQETARWLGAAKYAEASISA
jgi:hypothetical protein